ncbi:hypothetical protein LDJ79_13475 [Vibrio tritonius]|uniref:Uncharacterized protein n=1 Tax=Vibrio tritonius TaxID=1435069 RepID=A0ABS7YN85_9VIBR|nr:hypothetical protein [Vibrio tritonius]MCA2017131.1 hypothetical protein [Vibrio tritonius]
MSESEVQKTNGYDLHIAYIKYIAWLIVFIISLCTVKPVLTAFESKLPMFVDNLQSVKFGNYLELKVKDAAKQKGLKGIPEELSKLTEKEIETLLYFGPRNWSFGSYDGKFLYIHNAHQIKEFKSLEKKGFLSFSKNIDSYFKTIESKGFVKVSENDTQWKYQTQQVIPKSDYNTITASIRITKKGTQLAHAIIEVVSRELKSNK